MKLFTFSIQARFTAVAEDKQAALKELRKLDLDKFEILDFEVEDYPDQPQAKEEPK